MPIANSGNGRDETDLAKKKNDSNGWIAKEYAALRQGRAGLFLAAEERYRIPERLQKKIDRLARFIIRPRGRGCT